MRKVLKQFYYVFLLAIFVSVITIPSIKASASTNGHSQADAVAFATSCANNHWEINDGSGWTQCTEFVWHYYEYLLGYHVRGNACDYLTDAYGACPSGWTRPDKWSVQPGDILIWDKTASNQYGHVGVVLAVNGSTLTTAEANAGYARGACSTYTENISSVSGIIRPDWPSPAKLGTEMTSGYSRVLPDGDYIIACAGSPDKTTFCFMDIPGGDVPAATQTKVSLCQTDSNCIIGAHDVWTINYEDGFYTIKQKGTEMYLDVKGASKEEGANLQVYECNGNSNQKWAISKNGRNGYRIETKCSGFSVDVAGAVIQNEQKIWVWTDNDSDAQSWLFIPYKPSQPLKNGKYVFESALNEKYALGIDKNNLSQSVINAQLTNNVKDKYNVFEITKLDNGYYKIINSSTGKALELTNGYSNIGDNVNVYTENGSIPQQWEIKKVSGGYVFILRSSGMAMEVANGTAANATPVKQNYYTGKNAQVWKIVTYESLQKAKYKVVHYKEKTDGSYIKVDEESATAKIGSKVSPATKSYTGFTAPSKKTVTVKSDGSTVVKYYYTRNKYKLTWDLGGGKVSGSYTKGSVSYGTKITAPSSVKKTGYVFKGWSVSVPDKMPAKNLTIKAKWEAKNQKEVEAYVTRFYKVFLNRKPEKEGLDYWTEALITKQMTGADVARGFVLSKEMNNRKLSNEEFVTLMYKGFFDRVPDASGYSYWVGLLEVGYPKEKVVAGFVNSQEFKNLCKKYNINPGSL
jgi:hypothetical protein